MTGSLDLDVLEATARAATPGPWEFCDAHVIPRVESGSDVVAEEIEDLDNAAHIATFDPPTVLRLIERVRTAEAELVEAHTHFAVQEGRLREAVERAEKAEAAIERVRSIHRFETYAIGGSTRDDATYTKRCALCATPFPCPTVRALGGDQS